MVQLLSCSVARFLFVTFITYRYSTSRVLRPAATVLHVAANRYDISVGSRGDNENERHVRSYYLTIKRLKWSNVTPVR